MSKRELSRRARRRRRARSGTRSACLPRPASGARRRRRCSKRSSQSSHKQSVEDLTAAFIAEAEKRPLLAGIDPADVVAFVRKRHGEPIGVPEPAAPAEMPGEPVILENAGTASKRDREPFGYWLFGHQDLGPRLLLASSVVAVLLVGEPRALDAYGSSVRADAYRTIVAAAQRDEDRTVLGQGERFLSAYTFRREDAREQHVRALMAQAYEAPNRRIRDAAIGELRAALAQGDIRSAMGAIEKSPPPPRSPTRTRAHRPLWKSMRASSCTGSRACRVPATTTRWQPIGGDERAGWRSQFMRRLVGTIAIATLIACGAGRVVSPSRRARRRTDRKRSCALSRSRTERVGSDGPAIELSLDQPRSVTLNASAGMMQEFTPRERRDQSSTGCCSPRFRLRSLHPGVTRTRSTASGPLRLYAAACQLEFGDTRSRFIGNGTVLALVPANESAAARKEQLAHVAARTSKISPECSTISWWWSTTSMRAWHRHGGAPRRREVGRVVLARSTAMSSSGSRTPPDFRLVHGAADDLTKASKSPDSLVLGGRKIFAYPYRRIDVEMVATVWQAEAESQGGARRLRSRMPSPIVRHSTRVRRGRTYRTNLERQQLERDQDREWKG